MYVRVLQDELQFPEDKAMDQDTKSLIRGVSNLIEESDFDFLISTDSYSNETRHCASVSQGSRNILTSP